MPHKQKIKADPTTGFGTRSTQSGERFYRKDGRVNIIRRGVPFFDRFLWYHTMLSISRWKFYLILLTFYIIINLFFALIYYAIGVGSLNGVQTGSAFKNFAGAFFFSTQTFTTVGFGHISPVGFLASVVSSLEAFAGLLAIALASGLFYGRFSKPKPYLYFSEKALIAPYKEGKALMFRLVPYKNNHLIDAEVKLTLAMRVQEEGEQKNLFYPLDVEFSKLNSLVLNWTIVHPLTEESPLHGLTLQDIIKAKTELLVFIRAYDEVFSNSVVARTSYTALEIVENARFKPMYEPSENGSATVLNVDMLNDYEFVNTQ